MIAWFRKLFDRPDSFGYRPGQREIFEYWDGKRFRKGDPLAIHRAMLTDPDFDMNIDPGLAGVPHVKGLIATGRVAAAVRKAFAIAPLDAGGLTDGECLTLFCTFGAYIHQLTESSRPLASGPAPTEPPASDSIIAPTAASG